MAEQEQEQVDDQQLQQERSSKRVKSTNAIVEQEESQEQQHDEIMHDVVNCNTTTNTNNNDNTNTNTVSSLQLGDRVMFVGLKNYQRLNNQLGVIEEYLIDNNDHRYKVRPLGRRGKRCLKSRHVSAKIQNLQIVPPSSFLAKLSSSIFGDDEIIPFYCNVGVDDYGTTSIQIMFGDYMGRHVVQPLLDKYFGPNEAAKLNNIQDACYREVTTSISEDDVETQMSLQPDEVLILQEKVGVSELYDAMVDYELLQDIPDKTTQAGLHGLVSLSKILFPFTIPKSFYTDYYDCIDDNNDDDDDNNNNNGSTNINDNKNEIEIYNDIDTDNDQESTNKKQKQSNNF